MTRDPMRYWQSSDDPNWSDEREAAFITELSLFNIENAMRPRDEYDVDVHPESFRGKVLRYYDERDRVMAALASTWRGRMVLRLARLRRWLSRFRESIGDE